MVLASRPPKKVARPNVTGIGPQNGFGSIRLALLREQDLRADDEKNCDRQAQAFHQLATFSRRRRSSKCAAVGLVVVPCTEHTVFYKGFYVGVIWRLSI